MDLPPPPPEDAVAMIDRHEQEWQAYLDLTKRRTPPPDPPAPPAPVVPVQPPLPGPAKDPAVELAMDDWAREWGKPP